MHDSLFRHFRFPENSISLDLEGTPGNGPGYFRVGETALYGRLAGAKPGSSVADAPDVSGQIRKIPGACQLPFALDEVVCNLQRERYANNGFQKRKSPLSQAVREIYYFMRPWLGVGFRRHLQRLSLRGWNKAPFPKWPVDSTVNDLLNAILCAAMEASGLTELPFIWFWPEGKRACGVMTHDVEEYAGLKFASSLMDLNDEFGIKSSFQVIPEGRYQTPQAAIDEMRTRGFEMNVHDWNHDGFLYSDPIVFAERAAKINDFARRHHARGFRSGVLYRNTDWYDAFEFSYDMSLPNVGHLDPQPGGCCSLTPFFIGNIVELPLTTIQDYSLFHILNDYSIEIWKRQVEAIAHANGLMSFNVHPDYLIDHRARKVYSELLAFLQQFYADNNIWNALPHQVDAWWRLRNSMTLVRNGSGWEIEGEGSERARIAYAVREGQSLHYVVN